MTKPMPNPETPGMTGRLLGFGSYHYTTDDLADARAVTMACACVGEKPCMAHEHVASILHAERAATREAREEAAERKRFADDLAAELWEAADHYACGTCGHAQSLHRTAPDTGCGYCDCRCAKYVTDGRGIASLAADRDRLRADLAQRDAVGRMVVHALEQLTSAGWDYGKGLSVEYARSVHAVVQDALTALDAAGLDWRGKESDRG